jgi:hypothetical protein
MKHTGRASVDIWFHTVLAELLWISCFILYWQRFLYMEEQEADWQSSRVEHVAYGRALVKNMQHIGRAPVKKMYHIGRAPMGESVTYWQRFSRRENETYWQSFCGYLVS